MTPGDGQAAQAPGEQDLAERYRLLSLWHDDLAADQDWTPRTSLPGDATYDVVIVGAGFTGLWTAYHLSRLAPDCRVVVLEAEVAGFGASGRNGGWCSALFPVATPALARHHGRDTALRMAREMQASVRDVGDLAAAEGIDCHYERGGTVVVARTEVQRRRIAAGVAQEHAVGLGEDDIRMLEPDEARDQLAADRVHGASYTPHCAAIHPARLVRGLARAVEARGVTVHERSRVQRIEPGRVETEHGTVRADVVVRATEGYTPDLAGLRREVIPVYSLMVATEPLPDSTWERLGLPGRATFSDGHHLIVYGQRTSDGRIAFGGRGAPYHFGSRLDPGAERDPAVFAMLRSFLGRMLPGLGDVRFTHAWGGALGIARDWNASVGLDRTTGLGWAGGYVGDGVGTSQLAGRTLAELIGEVDSDRVSLPWVGHRSRRWEPEPLRWLGVNAGLRAMALADVEETRTGRSSVVARAMAPLLGGH